MLRVLHVVGDMQFGGGIESWLLQVFRSYDRERFQFDLCYTNEHPGDLSEILVGLGVNLFPCRMTLNYLSFPKRAARVFARGGYHVVHAHLQNFSGPTVHAAHLARVPIRIAHFHNTSEGHRNDWKRRAYLWKMREWIANEATNIVGCSQAALDAFFPDLTLERDPRLTTVYYGIDLSKFNPKVSKNYLRQKFGIASDSPIVGHVGRFAPQKNHRAFLEIAQRVLEQIPNVKFVLVGDGELRPAIEASVVEQGLGGSFVFVGHTNRVERLLADMDVFLFPSLWEGLGIVLLEAQATGVPVVASNVSGIREAVLEPCTTYLFDVGDQELAAYYVTEILRNRAEVRKRMTQLQDEVRKFTLEASLERLYELYTGSPNAQ